MAQFVFFHEMKRYLGEAVIDFTNHDFRAMLTNTAPDAAADSLKADIVEIAGGNGYVAGGELMSSVTWTETAPGSGVWRWTMNDFTWNASGGDIAQFRYVVWYDDSPTSPLKPLIGYVDYTTGIVVTNGNGFTVDIGASGVIELS